MSDRYNISKNAKIKLQKAKSYRTYTLRVPKRFADLLNWQRGKTLIIYPEMEYGLFTDRLIVRPEKLKMQYVPLAILGYLQKREFKKLKGKKLFKDIPKERLAGLIKGLYEPPVKDIKRLISSTEETFLKYGRAVFFEGIPTVLKEDFKDPKELEQRYDAELAKFETDCKKILKEITRRPKGGRRIYLDADVKEFSLPKTPPKLGMVFEKLGVSSEEINPEVENDPHYKADLEVLREYKKQIDTKIKQIDTKLCFEIVKIVMLYDVDIDNFKDETSEYIIERAKKLINLFKDPDKFKDRIPEHALKEAKETSELIKKIKNKKSKEKGKKRKR